MLQDEVMNTISVLPFFDSHYKSSLSIDEKSHKKF